LLRDLYQSHLLEQPQVPAGCRLADADLRREVADGERELRQPAYEHHQQQTGRVTERLELARELRELRLLLGGKPLGVQAAAHVVHGAEVEVDPPLSGEVDGYDDEAASLLLRRPESVGTPLGPPEVVLRQGRERVTRQLDLGSQVAAG